MKRALIFLLFNMLLLTACVNFTPSVEEMGNSTSEKTPSNSEFATPGDETTIPSDGTTTEVPPDDDSEITEPQFVEKPPLDCTPYYRTLKHLQDFYTFAQTGSTNPDDYESDKTKYAIEHSDLRKYTFEERELVKPEDLGVVSQKLLDEIYQVDIWETTAAPGYALYAYYLTSVDPMGDVPFIIIEVFPQKYTTNDVSRYTKKMFYEGGFPACFESNDGRYYLETVDDCAVLYAKSKYTYDNMQYEYWWLYFVVDGIYIEMSTPNLSPDSPDDPAMAEIAKFFRKDTYRDSLQQAITGIKNRG